ncbi:3-oxo-5a-steroid 4- dehydrogenase [Tilletia horrida]|uniref:3-oxo-5a-steroid 4- dehydrogenase n=1 Tax=Tilletia horrida TaxID=155126 RepID=A0AAN6GFF9_9BASI|nr:3-oxo-5a-steroid 4- dehydrogenase [Tilletia horrida]
MSFSVVVQKRASSKSKSKQGSTGEPQKSATSSPFPLQLTLPSASPTLPQLRQAIHAKIPKLHPSRQRIIAATTQKPLVAPVDENKTTLQELGVQEGDTLEVKDLGPQISWRTVFLIEYAGPIAIHPLFYLLTPQLHQSAQFEPSQVQTLALTLIVLHFVKRELETLFVHRFSNGTMPFTNVFKNSFHYWGLCGAFLAYFIYSPATSRSALAKVPADSIYALLRNDTFLLACTAVWTVAELANFHTHLQLMWLRPKGTRVRKIPRGGAFELVSCPNYFFEILAWVAITVLTLSPAALLFIVVGGVQMGAWADKKHRTLRKEFKDYPRNRKRMIPFIW